MSPKTIFLVAYSDDAGPYATPFSARAGAQAFVDDIGGDAHIIETEIDGAIPPGDDEDPAADRGDWEFHRDHDQ